MKITARLVSTADRHEIVVATDGNEKALVIAPRPGGGSSINGGELLVSALATCYCNDLYREARKRGIRVIAVRVDVEAEATPELIADLLRHTDRVAEVQNSFRAGVAVTFSEG